MKYFIPLILLLIISASAYDSRVVNSSNKTLYTIYDDLYNIISSTSTIGTRADFFNNNKSGMIETAYVMNKPGSANYVNISFRMTTNINHTTNLGSNNMKIHTGIVTGFSNLLNDYTYGVVDGTIYFANNTEATNFLKNSSYETIDGMFKSASPYSQYGQTQPFSNQSFFAAYMNTIEFITNPHYNPCGVGYVLNTGDDVTAGTYDCRVDCGVYLDQYTTTVVDNATKIYWNIYGSQFDSAIPGAGTFIHDFEVVTKVEVILHAKSPQCGGYVAFINTEKGCYTYNQIKDFAKSSCVKQGTTLVETSFHLEVLPSGCADKASLSKYYCTPYEYKSSSPVNPDGTLNQNYGTEKGAEKSPSEILAGLQSSESSDVLTNKDGGVTTKIGTKQIETTHNVSDSVKTDPITLEGGLGEISRINDKMGREVGEMSKSIQDQNKKESSLIDKVLNFSPSNFSSELSQKGMGTIKEVKSKYSDKNLFGFITDNRLPFFEYKFTVYGSEYVVLSSSIIETNLSDYIVVIRSIFLFVAAITAFAIIMTGGI